MKGLASACRIRWCPAKAVPGTGYCPAHRRMDRKRQEQGRPSTAARGYGGRWQRARRAYLQTNPLCVACRAEGRVAAATVVDHIVPHRGDQDLFWDETNWQALCIEHHNVKSAREGGGKSLGA
jgi:5-methylcytosine-specific restriction protein A